MLFSPSCFHASRKSWSIQLSLHEASGTSMTSHIIGILPSGRSIQYSERGSGADRRIGSGHTHRDIDGVGAEALLDAVDDEGGERVAEVDRLVLDDDVFRQPGPGCAVADAAAAGVKGVTVAACLIGAADVAQQVGDLVVFVSHGAPAPRLPFNSVRTILSSLRIHDQVSYARCAASPGSALLRPTRPAAEAARRQPP